MYVDPFYYSSEYGGELIPLEKFAKAEKKAEAYIRHLTYMHGDIFACENDTVKDAVCAVAEIYYSCDLKNQQGNGSVKSENTDGYSVTYVNEQVDGETAEAVASRKAYEVARTYLLPLGWLSRKVGYCDAYKCSDHAL